MILRTRQAMSPLIATVLLIAFAVALGAMIMNWSAGIEPGEGGEEDYCTGVSITTSQSICHDGAGIRFSIKNDGEERVDGLLIRLNNPQFETDLKIKQSSMVSQERLEITHPVLYTGENTEVIFIPLVEHSGEIHECLQGGFNQNKLPRC